MAFQFLGELNTHKHHGEHYPIEMSSEDFNFPSLTVVKNCY